MKLTKAADIVEKGAVETFSYYCFSPEHRRSLRTDNPLERINREIRRRTRVVGAFPDGNSALMLVAARLRHVASTKWGSCTNRNGTLSLETWPNACNKTSLFRESAGFKP